MQHRSKLQSHSETHISQVQERTYTQTDACNDAQNDARAYLMWFSYFINDYTVLIFYDSN
jgi:hypothetical protein